MRIRTKHHRLQHPEPGEPGSGPAPAAADPTPPSPPLANNQEPPPAPAPAVADPKAPEPKPADPDQSAKIDALLSEIGKDVGATPDPKPPADQPKAEDPPADPTKPAPTAEPKALDLTPPEGISERAKGRWAELSERAKLVPDLERRATEAESALTGVRELVRESGLDQTEFGNMLEMGRLFKSADPKDLQSALQQLDGLRADLATRLGVDAPGIDPLAAHPDLKADVENMAISRDRALEIARLRKGQATVEATTKATQEQQQFVRTVQAAAQEMDATLKERANLPGHAAKVAHITAYFKDPAKLQAFVTTYQPGQWKAAVLMMYDTFVPPAAPTPVPTPQPLRPGNVAAGPRVPNGRPVTALEAATSAWDQAGL